jgi:hypothetical protein
MISVTCPQARFNTHRELYSRMVDRMDFIKVTFDDNGHRFEKEMTVSEAERLAKDLMDWVRDIKGDEEEESA